MKKEQQRSLLDSIGGEPIEGSGFESEQATIEDEPAVRVPTDQQKGEDL